MKKIINIDRKPIIVDTDTADVQAINRSARGIDDIYVIPEDANIEWTSKFFPNKTICADVKKMIFLSRSTTKISAQTL